MKLKIMIMALLLLTGIGSAANRLPATEFVGDIDFASGFYARNATEGIFNVKDYGASPDDGIGDSIEIQAAIDDASEVHGIVDISGGVYILDTFVEDNYLLRMRSNVTIRGNGVLRVGDGIRDGTNPIFVLYEFDESVRIENVDISGVTIDFNGENNIVPNSSWIGTPVMNRLGASNVSNIRIHDMTFRNASGHHYIYLGRGQPEDDQFCDIYNCRFEYTTINLRNDTMWDQDYDHSSLYISMDNANIHDNTLWNPYGAQFNVMNSVMTAIEIHGSNARVYNNHVENYFYGVIVTNAEDNARNFDNIVICNNEFIGVGRGIAMYEGAVGKSFNDIFISNNKIILDNWNYPPFTELGFGCDSVAEPTTAPNITLTNNYIRGTYKPNVNNTWNNSYPVYIASFNHVTMTGNEFNTFATGVWINTKNTVPCMGATISGNKFVDTGGYNPTSGFHVSIRFRCWANADYFVVNDNQFEILGAYTPTAAIYTTGSGTISNTNIQNNRIDSAYTNQVYMSHSAGGVTIVKLDGSGAPTAGYFGVGSIVYDSTPSASGTIGWVCTTAGTPGTWKTWGAIAA